MQMAQSSDGKHGSLLRVFINNIEWIIPRPSILFVKPSTIRLVLSIAISSGGFFGKLTFKMRSSMRT